MTNPKVGQRVAQRTKPCLYGYDGNGYTIGDRVELHPGMDLWMQGARYGTVTATLGNRVHVVLDRVPKKVLSCSEGLLRRVD